MSLTKVSNSMITGAMVNVLDYGADASGVTDSTSAIQAAFNAAKAIALATVTYGVTVYFPRGSYKTTSTLTIPYYVNLLGETTEGSIIVSQFNSDTFTEELASGVSVLYFTRIEELSVLKCNTDGTNNTTGKIFNFHKYMSFCSFRRLRLYGGEYSVFMENVGYSLWNTFEQINCYYATICAIYIGQGSNATRFNDCSFNVSASGVSILGTSFNIIFVGCAFEGNTLSAISLENANVYLSGCYLEQYGSQTLFSITGTGTVDVVGSFVNPSSTGYLGTLNNSSNAVRYSNCTLYNIPATYWDGTYGKQLIQFSDNNAIGTTPAKLQGYNISGTFTPILYGTTTSGTGTYTNQVGLYTRVGNLVTFQIDLTWTAHTGTGNMGIDQLPYSSGSAADYAVSSVLASNLTFTGQLGGAVQQNTNKILLYAIASNTALAYQPMDTTGTLTITGTYFAA
jgi:Pectate lyase superfamily protein